MAHFVFMPPNPTHLLKQFNPATGELEGAQIQRRHLSDLQGCFLDFQAYTQALKRGNSLLYTVSAIEPGHGAGDLHYGVGCLMPGRIGQEYYMTKGHLHAWREAAEVYIGLSGEGCMLLQDETSGKSRLVPLKPHHAIYVPGHTAHRTINSGASPLIYLGIYPAAAGHDYEAIAKRNFLKVVVEQDGVPVMRDRTGTL